MKHKETMNIVVVGHVDHGKSTLIGRLLVDTNSVAKEKIEMIKKKCEKDSKNFEYAFILDALKEEQDQGVTIDIARCFFKSEKRYYLILDAPGHIEFIKNMITGAAKAEAALLVIDANEGIKENSKRHAYILSFLGIKQVAVVINKMDLVNYNRTVYEKIKEEYEIFLNNIGIYPSHFIAVSAKCGDNVVKVSKKMNWFDGLTVLKILDSFKKAKEKIHLPFRMPIQDVYKFTKFNDSRRLIVGRIETGKIHVKDEIIILPTNRRTKIKSIEVFNKNNINEAYAGQSIALTFEDPIFVKRGEVIVKSNEKMPYVNNRFIASIFWMGEIPLEEGNYYIIKINTNKTRCKIKKIIEVLDSSTLDTKQKRCIEKNESGKVIIECDKNIVFDLFNNIKETGRFVIQEGYDIRGGGIILEKFETSKAIDEIFSRGSKWDLSSVSKEERGYRFGQKPFVILITGPSNINKKNLARKLERLLFSQGRVVYFLGIRNILRGLDIDTNKENRAEHLRRLAEVAYIMKDAGLIVIITASDLNNTEIELMKTIIGEEILVIIVGHLEVDEINVDIHLDPEDSSEYQLEKITQVLIEKKIIFGFK